MEVIIDGVAFVKKDDFRKNIEEVVLRLQAKSQGPEFNQRCKGLNEGYYYSYRMIESFMDSGK